MKYCSECGMPITLQWVAEENRGRHVCTSCGMTHYKNPRVLVSCIVCWGDKVLMCRRAQEPALGQWMIPSGFLECGETLEEGAARETLEETGVALDPAQLQLCTIMNMTVVDQVAITFRTNVTTEPRTVPGPECLEVAFLAEQDIPATQFAWREAMASEPRQFFDELKSGVFSIRLITIASKDGKGFKSRRYRVSTAVGEDKA